MNSEKLAKRIIAGVEAIAPKLAELEKDIRALWAEFEKLPKGQTIAGCRTKTEFCRRHLGRTPRAIQYMLAGRREQSSRPTDVRRKEVLGEECVERHAEELRTLKGKLRVHPPQKTNLEWAPQAPDPRSCTEYDPDADRYRLTLVVSKDEVEKVAVALGPEQKPERKQLLQEVIESLKAGDAVTTRVRFERFVEQLAKGLSLEEDKERAA